MKISEEMIAKSDFLWDLLWGSDICQKLPKIGQKNEKIIESIQ